MISHADYRRYASKLKNAFIAIVLVATAVPAYPAQAQSDSKREGITMSPTSRQYTLDAGSVMNDKLTIINDGTTDYDFLLYARPYSIENNQYDKPDFTTTVQNADLYSWVQFPTAKYHIKAGATMNVSFSVHVPSEAAPGGHYGVVFAEVQPSPEQAAGNSVVRKKRVGAIIYATVNGAVKLVGNGAGGEIPFWQVQPPLRATVAAKNTGNTHFTDKIKLTVRDVLGNVRYQSTKDYQVLPGTTRTVETNWESAPWFGFYRVETEQKFLDKTIQSSGYVLMMPRLLPVLLVVMVIIGGVYASYRRNKK